VSASATAIFLDTSYVYALVNTRDEWHAAAARWERKLASEARRLVTTEFILIEIADGLAALKFRTHASQIIATLRASALVEVVSASSDLFSAALDLQ
jgi:predicted nucleic acid-binding protein